MLQIFREKAQGTITWLIVLAIAAAFALFGLSDYFSSSNHSSSIAAKVNGQKITWASVDNLYERAAQQYGDQVEPRILKEQILRAMVQQTVWLSSVQQLGFRVGDEQVAKILTQIPAFQVDGQFSKDQYLKALEQTPYTDSGFRRELYQDILLGQLEQGIAQSSFTMQDELSNTVALLDQKRNFGYLLIPTQKTQKEIKITPEQIQSYYKTHKADFIKPEQVMLEYVVLSLEDLADTIKPSMEDAKAYYQEHQAQYTTPERVHARHILIAVPQNDPSLAEKAKSKVDNLLTELKKGADFDKLAKQSSNDPGSAKKGGDLGWFVRGQMIPEFEKVAFELKPGTISGPVRTPFGYHIIQVIDHKQLETRSFSEVRNLVEEQIKRNKAEALFAEKGEALAKLVFEQNGSLAPVSEQFGLKIQETEPFSREGGKGIAGNPEVVRVAFSDELLQQSRNSEPLKISDTSMAAVRVKKHYPAEQQALSQVEKQIQHRIEIEQAKLKTKELGEKLVMEIKESGKPAQIAKNRKLAWVVKQNIIRTPGELDRNIVMAAFQIPPSDSEPNVKGFVLPNGDYLVLVLQKVIPGNLSEMDDETRKAYRQGLTDISSQLEYALYATDALKNVKVEFAKVPS